MGPPPACGLPYLTISAREDDFFGHGGRLGPPCRRAGMREQAAHRPGSPCAALPSRRRGNGLSDPDQPVSSYATLQAPVPTGGAHPRMPTETTLQAKSALHAFLAEPKHVDVHGQLVEVVVRARDQRGSAVGGERDGVCVG